MSFQVLFNGAVLVRPGGATNVDASAMTGGGLSGDGVVGLVGESDAGAPNTVYIYRAAAAEAAKALFRSGPLADAIGLAVQPANDKVITTGAQQLVLVKTNQSTRATRTLSGVGTAAGTSAAGKAGPYNLEPNQTVVFSIDGAGDVTKTFTAVKATKAGAGAAATYDSPDTKTLLIKVDGGETQTFTANAGCTASAATAALINTQIRGLSAVVNGFQVDLVSDLRGKLSSIEILAGGTGNAVFGQATGLVNGVAGSNVNNIDAVTAVEAATVLASTGSVIAGDPVTITSVQVGGTSSIEVKVASTATDFGFDNVKHSGNDPVSVMTLTSKEYGAHTNKIAALVAEGAGGHSIEISYEDGLKRIDETSPNLGITSELTLEYIGASATAVAQVTATQLIVTLSGGSGGTHIQADGSADLVVPFSTYKTLQEVINYINQQTGYTAVAVTTNPYTFDPVQLDYVTGVNVKNTVAALYAQLFRMIDWINSNSSLVTATRNPSTGTTAPATTNGAHLSLTGGARGVSINSNWQDAFNAMMALRVNNVVPLASENLANLAQGSSATFASIAAMADAHAAIMSSTIGKSERQNFMGMKGTKTQVLAEAALLNSFNTCLTCQQVGVLDASSNLTVMPEWAFAVQCAGMRAGAELGEPLTWKYVRAQSLTQDASWNPQDDGDDMILGGVLIAEDTGKGFRIMKGVTTYTREDNNAYTEESVVSVWKNVAYELRTHLENLFIGRKLSIKNVNAIRQEADGKLYEMRDAGEIVDSIMPDGSRLRAYRNLTVSATGGTVTVSVTCSPVEGINWILNNIYLVPAQINV